MTAALPYRPPSHIWTTDDLDRLPEENCRRELLDGVLLIYPGPTAAHQIITGRLAVALEQSCPREYEVTQGVEVRISPRRSFIPDVLVVTDEAAQRVPRHFAPYEVVLAVEIVSPTSQSMDRITKPALYARAGIPYYWRIETDGGITVHAHKIDPAQELYEPVGTFTDVIDTPEPWRIEIPIRALTPRHL